jgi:hypothetical protein
MNKTSKSFALLVILIIATSSPSLIFVQPASAQSIPTPSVPKFSMSYANSSIEVSILNQPFSPHQTAGGGLLNLYYTVREKEHTSDNWNYYPQYQGNWYPNGNYPATNADYTVIRFEFHSSSSGPLTLNSVINGAKLDFQVQAAIGFYVKEPYYPHGQSYPPSSEGTVQVFSGYFSDWSNTQMISIGEISVSTSPNPTATSTPTPMPTTTVPEFSSWTIPLLLTIMLALAGLLDYHKKHKGS